MPFDPFKHQAAFIDPTYLSNASAWVGHIPFAATIIELAKPRTIVELGTLRGDSYCAFCQSVVELKLETRCTAIDTWRGDAHTGGYDDRVLTELRAYHDPVYGQFSRLLQSDFDSAVGRFPDGSIDLLHIDGHHTYDAVRHDFETWLPKVSDRGVMLFHDTAARQRDFGVWKLWKELAGKFPSFAFEHENGLGVLGVGPRLSEAVGRFFGDANEQPELVRRYFATLGNRVILGRDLIVASNVLQRQRQVLDDWIRRTGRAADATPTKTFASYAGRVLRDFELMAGRSSG